MPSSAASRAVVSSAPRARRACAMAAARQSAAVAAGGVPWIAAPNRSTSRSCPPNSTSRLSAKCRKNVLLVSPARTAICATVVAGQAAGRTSVVRVPPITHSILDRHGFARTLIAIARRTGVAGYAGDGANRWPAGQTLDVGRLYRLALEEAPAGTRWHAAGDEGIAVREIAESIGRHLNLPAQSIPAERMQEHFGFLAGLIALDGPVTTEQTRRILGWEPVHPGLLADFDEGD